jgi:hypothetical protein
LAEAKVADAAEARRRARRLRELHMEESTLRGVLWGLADLGRSVVVVTSGGRRTTGVLIDIGWDVIVVETGAGTTAALLIGSLLAVEAAGLAPGASGPGRSDPGDRTFADVVADLVGTGQIVGCVLSSGVRLDGEVLGVGQDVVIVRAGAQTIYVALDSLNELAWSTSVG